MHGNQTGQQIALVGSNLLRTGADTFHLRCTPLSFNAMALYWTLLCLQSWVLCYCFVSEGKTLRERMLIAEMIPIFNTSSFPHRDVQLAGRAWWGGVGWGSPQKGSGRQQQLCCIFPPVPTIITVLVLAPWGEAEQERLREGWFCHQQQHPEQLVLLTAHLSDKCEMVGDWLDADSCVRTMEPHTFHPVSFPAAAAWWWIIFAAPALACLKWWWEDGCTGWTSFKSTWGPGSLSPSANSLGGHPRRFPFGTSCTARKAPEWHHIVS